MVRDQLRWERGPVPCRLDQVAALWSPAESSAASSDRSIAKAMALAIESSAGSRVFALISHALQVLRGRRRA